MLLTGHLGATYPRGVCRRTRDVRAARASFDEMLGILGTDHVDILMLHWVDDERDLGRVLDAGGSRSAWRTRSRGRASAPPSSAARAHRRCGPRSTTWRRRPTGGTSAPSTPPTFWRLQRRCTYCDHCLPCPEGIRIGDLLRAADMGDRRAAGVDTGSPASACTACGLCEKRCPFEVPVITRVREAARRAAG